MASDAVNARVSTVNIKTLVQAINKAGSGVAREASVDNLRLPGLARPLPKGSVRNLSSQVLPEDVEEDDDDDDDGDDDDNRDEGGGSVATGGYVEVELPESKPVDAGSRHRRRWNFGGTTEGSGEAGASREFDRPRGSDVDASGEARAGTGAEHNVHPTLVHDSSTSQTSFRDGPE